MTSTAISVMLYRISHHTISMIPIHLISKKTVPQLELVVVKLHWDQGIESPTALLPFLVLTEWKGAISIVVACQILKVRVVVVVDLSPDTCLSINPQEATHLPTACCLPSYNHRLTIQIHLMVAYQLKQCYLTVLKTFSQMQEQQTMVRAFLSHK